MEDLGKPRRRKTGGGSRSRKEKFPSSVSTLSSSTSMCLIGFHLPWQQNTDITRLKPPFQQICVLQLQLLIHLSEEQIFPLQLFPFLFN
ncbi:hypothetical protein LINPERHAP1_LOCUS39506 [Linum perenne]